MNYKPALLASMLLLGAAAGWLLWTAETSKAASANKTAINTQSIAVTSQRVQRQTVPVQLKTTGTVTSLNSVDIRPQLSNIVSQVHIREGQTVQAGELLFSLDERNDQVNLQKAEAQLARDRATLADFERQFIRSRELRQKGFISQSSADSAQSQLEAQQASTRASQAAAESARINLGFNRIRAPFSGRIGAISLRRGSLAQANTTTLLTLTQLDPIEISFTLPERELSKLLAARQQGEVIVHASQTDAQEQHTGKLSFIDNAVDTQSGTIRLKALFTNTDQTLWPGAYASVQITLQELKNALVIPLAAVVNAVDGTFVYRIDAQQQAQRQKIEILHQFGTQAVIRGLTEDERIVVDGTQNLRPGVRVREAGKAQMPTSAPDHANHPR